MNANLNINNVSTHYASLSELEHDAARKHTSVEILYAIAEMANDDEELTDLWENGTDVVAIYDRALELANDDTEILFWGGNSFSR